MLIITLQARGELAPDTYRQLQLNSPEALTIQVIDVSSMRKSLVDFSGNSIQKVTAKIIKIERTSSGLKIGDTIIIRYTSENPKRKIAGPRPIGKLEKDKVYSAWLEKTEGKASYSPGARGASFSALIK